MSRLFEPNESVTRWTAGLYRTVAVLSLPVLMFRLIQAAAGDGTAVQGAADGMAGLVGLVSLAAGILLLVWTYQAYGNLEPLGNHEPTLATGWAVAGWLIPIASLVLPYIAMRELWQSSERTLASAGREARRTVPIPYRLHIWWGLKAIAGLYAVGSLVGLRFLEPVQRILIHQHGYLWANVLTTALTVVNSFLLAGILGAIQERQVARWHWLEARRRELS